MEEFFYVSETILVIVATFGVPLWYKFAVGLSLILSKDYHGSINANKETDRRTAP